MNGFVYVLFNAAFPEMVKIGSTTRTPEDRARELSEGTGMPLPYVVVFRRPVGDALAAEAELHERLKAYRIRNDREHFRLAVEMAIEAADEVARHHPSREPSIGRTTNEQGEPKDFATRVWKEYVRLSGPGERKTLRDRLREGAQTVNRQEMYERLKEAERNVNQAMKEARGAEERGSEGTQSPGPIGSA